MSVESVVRIENFRVQKKKRLNCTENENLKRSNDKLESILQFETVNEWNEQERATFLCDGWSRENERASKLAEVD